MDLDLGWRIGVGFAKRLNQDSDGSKSAGLRGDAQGSDSAENENKNQYARCANHDEPLPESAAKSGHGGMKLARSVHRGDKKEYSPITERFGPQPQSCPL